MYLCGKWVLFLWLVCLFVCLFVCCSVEGRLYLGWYGERWKERKKERKRRIFIRWAVIVLGWVGLEAV